MSCFLCICIFSGLYGKIQGTVIDEYTQDPIPDADVVIINTDLGAATNENGFFIIMNAPPGNYIVEISYIGYQTKRIRNVIVEVDRATRLAVSLEQTLIEMPPVTVTSELPQVHKEYVSATYIVRKTDLPHMPIDYTTRLVAFQAAVARSDTALHVRGGRATEVLYMLDNVPIVDPQTGDLAINLSKGVVDEIIFLPGGYDSEYGRAMSGVINLLSITPGDKVSVEGYGKTETIMPFYSDFGYQNYRASITLPIKKNFKGLCSIDLMHTDDWDPKLYILPHKQRDDYSIYGKWIWAPSGKLNLALSGAKGRSQFDRYNTYWKFYLDHYRSDMRTSDIEVFRVNYLPNPRYMISVVLSRLATSRIFGIRETESASVLTDFSYRDYQTLEWPQPGRRNPFGASYTLVICDGDYPEYQEKTSHILRVNVGTNLQIHKRHELKLGCDYAYQELSNFDYFVSDEDHQIIDEYDLYPREFAFYLQDNIDFEGAFIKVGCRSEHFDWDIGDRDPVFIVSPRVGASFMVTEQLLFRANIGQYIQPPLYDYIYSYYRLLPLPSYIKNIPPVGNPSLDPEKTISFEIGLQGELSKDVGLTVNSYYKTVTDLVGTRLDTVGAQTYLSYFNVEYANIRGIETILDYIQENYNIRVSYTISWAQGLSSHALETWERRYVDPEFSPAAKPYFLDFDQRRRLFIQGTLKMPLATYIHIFGYFGDGFPYTPPGPEGKYEERNIETLPFQRQVDCAVSKVLKIGKLSASINLEIINILGERYEISAHFPMVPLETITKDQFDHDPPYIDLLSAYYAPSADTDHDGLLTPNEEYLSFLNLITATDDWVSAYTAPRRARLGLSITFN